MGGGPDGGGGGNQGASAVSRGLGQPCFCLISGEADDGVTKPGYPLPWLLMVVVLALGLILLPPPDDCGELVEATLPRVEGAYGVVLSGSVAGMGCAEAMRVAKTSFRGDWRAGGGATRVVSMLSGAFSEKPFFSGTETECCRSGFSGVIAGGPKLWKDGGAP